MSATLSSRPGTNCSANQRPPNSARRASSTLPATASPRDDRRVVDAERGVLADGLHDPRAVAGARRRTRPASRCRRARSSALAASLSRGRCRARSDEQPVNGTPSDSSSAGDDVHELAAAFERLDEIEDDVRRKRAQSSLERAEVEPDRQRRRSRSRASRSAAAMACASSSVSLESGRPAAAAASCSSTILGAHRDAPARSAGSRRSTRHRSCRPSRPCSADRSSPGASPASGLTSSICGRPAPSSRTSTRPASRQPRQRQVASATVLDLGAQRRSARATGT